MSCDILLQFHFPILGHPNNGIQDLKFQFRIPPLNINFQTQCKFSFTTKKEALMFCLLRRKPGI
jgi:hypothetical protein